MTQSSSQILEVPVDNSSRMSITPPPPNQVGNQAIFEAAPVPVVSQPANIAPPIHHQSQVQIQSQSVNYNQTIFDAAPAVRLSNNPSATSIAGPVAPISISRVSEQKDISSLRIASTSNNLSKEDVETTSTITTTTTTTNALSRNINVMNESEFVPIGKTGMVTSVGDAVTSMLKGNGLNTQQQLNHSEQTHIIQQQQSQHQPKQMPLSPMPNIIQTDEPVLTPSNSTMPLPVKAPTLGRVASESKGPSLGTFVACFEWVPNQADEVAFVVGDCLSTK
jgi:hypothetical protein